MKLEERHRRTGDAEDRVSSFLAVAANGEAISPSPTSHQTSQVSRSRSRTTRLSMGESGASDYRERLDRTENSTESDDGNRQKSASGSRLSSCTLEEQQQGRMVLNTEVELPVDTVFNLLFVHDQFMIDVLSVRKTTDILSTPWQEQEEGRRLRQMTYNMSLSLSSIGSKVSYVTERQVIQETQPGKMYIVETEAINTGIPYADAFTVCNHYRLSQGTDGRTNLTVWSHVKYRKTIWGIVKGMLEKNTYNGVEALMTEIVSQLGAEADKMAPPAMVRRRRRAHTPGDRARGHGSGCTHKLVSSKGTRAPARPAPSLGWVGMVVMAAVVVLVLGNAILYSRLMHLEQQARLLPERNALPEDRLVAMPASWEAVVRILQRQEELHHHHLKNWKAKIEDAVLRLTEVQDSLELLLATIPEHQQGLRLALQQQSDFFEKLEDSKDSTEQLLEDLVQESSQTQEPT